LPNVRIGLRYCLGQFPRRYPIPVRFSHFATVYTKLVAPRVGPERFIRASQASFSHPTIRQTVRPTKCFPEFARLVLAISFSYGEGPHPRPSGAKTISGGACRRVQKMGTKLLDSPPIQSLGSSGQAGFVALGLVFWLALLCVFGVLITSKSWFVREICGWNWGQVWR
jgi:hypothetical protein